MPKPKAVVWDIDDVLTPTSMTFYESVMRTHGKCPHPDHWSDYLWGKHIDTPEGFETAQYLIKHEIIETTLPYSYTKQALMLTHQADFKNILLSARSWHPNPGFATGSWALVHDLSSLIEEAHFVTVDEPKRIKLQALGEIYDVQAFVEDNPVHIRSAVGIVPNLFLVRREWNKDHQNNVSINHVDTALEAAQHIIKLS